MKIVYTPDFKKWLDKWKAFVSSKNIPSKKDLPNKCESELLTLLKSHNIGYSWKDPLINSLFLELLDLPLDDGIHIEVGGTAITEVSLTAKTFVVDEGRKLEGVRIVITKDISPHELSSFIKKYQTLLHGLYKHLGLPASVKEGYDVNIVNAIVTMRDKKKMKFKDIATFLYDAYSEQEKPKQSLERFNETNVQKIYSDFKKSLPKTNKK